MIYHELDYRYDLEAWRPCSWGKNHRSCGYRPFPGRRRETKNKVQRWAKNELAPCS